MANAHEIQMVLDAASAQWRRDRSRYHLTLGGLIAALKKISADVYVEFDDGSYPGKPHSYRGYYSDLSFKPTSERVTVQDVLIFATAALGATFEGYKGGDFVMGEDTPLWMASWGNCGRAIVGVREPTEADWRVVLQTKDVD